MLTLYHLIHRDFQRPDIMTTLLSGVAVLLAALHKAGAVPEWIFLIFERIFCRRQFTER